MVFSSITFLLYFFPVCLAVYGLLPHRYRNGWLIFSSLFFFSWGAPLFIFPLVASCILDYWCAGRFETRHRKTFIAVAIILDCALLFYFKYFNFFADNFNALLQLSGGSKLVFTRIVLPAGISFLTFHKISFLVDVYRGHCKYPAKFSEYLLYILLFPHLIAGPIVRFSEIYPQITSRNRAFVWDAAFCGFMQFVLGLAKKVLVANVLGAYVDEAFRGDAAPAGFSHAWIVMLFYSMQLYFDFSGYSDMAIGMARMFGFRFPDNFYFPYTSKGITEFWKRWHMTLGSWMRDYLYIPLGGNRKGSRRTLLNLFVVFLISGLWHGAEWTFVVWGMFHGMFLVFERAFPGRNMFNLPALISVPVTFIVVVTGWVFFRSGSLPEAWQTLEVMFGKQGFDFGAHPPVSPKAWLVFAIASAGAFLPYALQEKVTLWYRAPATVLAVNIAKSALLLAAGILVLGELLATGFNPFIYFKF